MVVIRVVMVVVSGHHQVVMVMVVVCSQYLVHRDIVRDGEEPDL